MDGFFPVLFSLTATVKIINPDIAIDQHHKEADVHLANKITPNKLPKKIIRLIKVHLLHGIETSASAVTII